MNAAQQSFHCSIRVILLAGIVVCCAGSTVWGQTSQVTVVSAASYTAPVAAESIAVAYGAGLAAQTVVAPEGLPLPTELAGTSLALKDSAGTERPAQLFFVSPGQINFVAPSGMAMGAAMVMVRRDGREVGTGTLRIESVAPGLFAANPDGKGVAAGNALRVRSDGSQVTEPLTRFDATQNRVVAVPIDLTSSSDQVFLILFGTGLRSRSSLAGVSATIGAAPAEVLFAGATPGFVGLDQVNLRLPSSLSGRGEANIVLLVDGKPANIVTVTIGNPMPGLTNLTPNSATAGGSGFTLTVNGTNFVNGSVVRWNGQNRPTTFVSGAQLTAQIPASDLAAAGMAQLTVFNPSPGGGTSNALTFNVTATALAIVSAASLIVGPVAPESIAIAYGAGLSDQTVSATTIPLPTVLAGATLTITDSAGAMRIAPLFFVSPAQINFQVPAGTASGNATVTARRNNAVVSMGNVQVATVTPGLFSANSDGKGVALGSALRVRPNGSQVTEAIARFDAAQNRFVAVPIDLAISSDQVFLILFGTGLRNRSSLTGVSATIGGEPADLLAATAVQGAVGLDQVNLRLPLGLRGRGEVNVVLRVDGREANTVTVTIR